MRDIKVIEAEIAKLQAELEDTKAYDVKVRAASHILENLGWTWSRKTGWKKPEKPEITYKYFDKDLMTHIKAGDWVKYDGGEIGGYAYVRSVSGNRAVISMVQGVRFNKAYVPEFYRTVPVSTLKVVSYDQMARDMIGR
ncbi:hypothetical protein vBYenPRambo_020 [Yersinia phage vB_YenP_Rambo]|uniref:Uncharacterized protein n=1 Tax=Yersinia phage vB_YenP_Rambo TaxID=2880894 RepID=A0AC61TNS4_9CAUD|nr:hypothetical protein vBYenPRambo_020 [Yersinia phage vB_YenP_Rambo]